MRTDAVGNGLLDQVGRLGLEQSLFRQGLASTAALFDTGPVIETSWIHATERYRYATIDDVPAIARMLSDPEVGRWLWFTPASAEAIEAFFEPFLRSQVQQLEAGETPTTAVFIVEDLAAEFLGQGAVVAVDGSPGGFEIGFQLRKESWGRGVGARLSQFLCAYAVVIGDAYRIEGACLEGNAGSRTLLSRLGLELEATKPGYRSKQGIRHTELQFGAEVERLDTEAIRQTARKVGLLPPTDPAARP